ncbi:hypothetical protein C8Q80DRAFT_790678 [Daedaleopsis nitida]|nr:hypothetical protein C8Q80DRAFT_790678 [Daedaleopsis nitida]
MLAWLASLLARHPKPSSAQPLLFSALDFSPLLSDAGRSRPMNMRATTRRPTIRTFHFHPRPLRRQRSQLSTHGACSVRAAFWDNLFGQGRRRGSMNHVLGEPSVRPGGLTRCPPLHRPCERSTTTILDRTYHLDRQSC